MNPFQFKHSWVQFPIIFQKLKHGMACFCWFLFFSPTHTASNKGDFSRGPWMRLQSSKIRASQLCIVGLLLQACVHMQHHPITLSAALFLETNGSINVHEPRCWPALEAGFTRCIALLCVSNITEIKRGSVSFFLHGCVKTKNCILEEFLFTVGSLAHMFGRCVMKAISGPIHVLMKQDYVCKMEILIENDHLL